jgi:hypothetical protein
MCDVNYINNLNLIKDLLIKFYIDKKIKFIHKHILFNYLLTKKPIFELSLYYFGTTLFLY